MLTDINEVAQLKTAYDKSALSEPMPCDYASVWVFIMALVIIGVVVANLWNV